MPMQLQRALPALLFTALCSSAALASWDNQIAQDHIAMMVAIRNATEALPQGILHRTDLSDADRELLAAAAANATSVTQQAFDKKEQLCAQVREGHYLSSDKAGELAEQMTLIDTYYANAAVPYYKRLLQRLSPEGAKALQLLKTRILALHKTRSIDWKVYAQDNPADMVNTVYASCRS